MTEKSRIYIPTTNELRRYQVHPKYNEQSKIMSNATSTSVCVCTALYSKKNNNNNYTNQYEIADLNDGTICAIQFSFCYCWFGMRERERVTLDKLFSS